MLDRLRTLDKLRLVQRLGVLDEGTVQVRFDGMERIARSGRCRKLRSIDNLVRPLPRHPKVPLQLHPQPKICWAPTDFFQPDPHLGGNAAMAVQQIRKRLARVTVSEKPLESLVANALDHPVINVR